MKKYIFLVLFASFFISSCANQVFIIEEEGKTATKPIETEWSDFFVSGLGQKDTLNAKAICGKNNKVVKIELQRTAMNVVVSMFFGSYVPREYRVYCLRN